MNDCPRQNPAYRLTPFLPFHGQFLTIVDYYLFKFWSKSDQFLRVILKLTLIYFAETLQT
jgi:hypothetical protein